MRATTRPLDHEVDLNDVCRHDGYLFVRNGVGVAGRGRALVVDADEAVGRLAAIAHDDQSDGMAGPVALGCLPFRPGASAQFVIPSVIVRKTAGGGVFITTIDQPSESDVRLFDSTIGPTAPTFRVGPRTPIDTYRRAVEAGREAVRRGDLTKVVIAREVGVESDQPLDVHAILLRLRAAFGASYRYSIDGIVGASPELLIAVDGDSVRSHPLAGTTPRTGDPATDEALANKLMASMKDQVEHRVVIDVVHDTLLPWCSYLDWEPEPSVIKVANVQHLGTLIEGRLSEPRPDAVALARLLSPTPALGGHPREEAIALIDATEGFDRGRYGGAVGWVDAAGNGEFAVTIRCAELSADRRSARLIAGGGIVADSDVDAELAETQAKFQAMLSAIVRP
ncbi:MAG: isochorismate synthase [Ilumatobacteraceae bacterium]